MTDAPDHFEVARRRLHAARYCLDGEFTGVAVAETYYAMADVVRGALERRGTEPKTHSGLETLFYKRFVDGGPVPKRLHKAFVHAYEARWRWHYRSVEPTAETVDRYRDAATTLLDRLSA